MWVQSFLLAVYLGYPWIKKKFLIFFKFFCGLIPLFMMFNWLATAILRWFYYYAKVIFSKLWGYRFLPKPTRYICIYSCINLSSHRVPHCGSFQMSVFPRRADLFLENKETIISYEVCLFTALFKWAASRHRNASFND